MKNQWQNSVFLISSSDSKINRFGTGFAIYLDQKATLILTCAHVIHEVGGSSKVLINNSKATVIVSGENKGIDLCILKLHRLPGVFPIPLSDLGQKGTIFFTIGFQLFGNDFLIRPLAGLLSEQVGLETRKKRLRIKAWDIKLTDNNTLQPGYSGAPVLDEEKKCAIGIISHRQGEGERGLAISTEALLEIWNEKKLLLPGNQDIKDKLFNFHHEIIEIHNPDFDLYKPLLPPEPQIDPLLLSGGELTQQISHFIDFYLNLKILFISGSSGCGKTAAVARFLHTQKSNPNKPLIVYVDLSVPKNSKSFLEGRSPFPKTEQGIIILDHFECILDFTKPQTAYRPIDNIEKLLRMRNRIIVLIDILTEVLYQEHFGLTPGQRLQLIIGVKCISCETVATLTEKQVMDFCKITEISPKIFFEKEMRQVGILNLGLVAMEKKQKPNDSIKKLNLQILFIKRLLNQKPEKIKQISLPSLMRAVARRTLGYPKAFVSLSELLKDLTNSITTTQLKEAVSEPLQYKHGRISFLSSSVEKVAAALSLVEMLECEEINIPILRPPSKDLLPLMADITKLFDIKEEQIYKELKLLRSQTFDQIGYNAMIYTNLLLVTKNRPVNLDLSNLWLQGPKHQNVKRIPKWALDKINEKWVHMLFKVADELLNRLQLLVEQGEKSCYAGGREFWNMAREWAKNQPVKLVITDTLREAMSQNKAWRYEDVLDVLVTDVSTLFLKNLESEIKHILVKSGNKYEEILADIWDGMNDGAWDTIMNMQDKLEHLFVPNKTLRSVNFSNAHIERASFNNSDVTNTCFDGASLLLADFRSAKGVCCASFNDAAWYNAILCPADRYTLNKKFYKDDGYLKWCKNPPWRNPFYIDDWPNPFGD